jgi:hypothetical protein
LAIDDPTTIDSMGIDKVTGEVVMLISDHLSWTENLVGHFQHLEAKLNSYLSFAEGPQIADAIPQSVGRKRRIDLVHEFEPTLEVAKILDGIRTDMAARSIVFCYKPLPPGY